VKGGAGILAALFGEFAVESTKKKKKKEERKEVQEAQRRVRPVIGQHSPKKRGRGRIDP